MPLLAPAISGELVFQPLNRKAAADCGTRGSSVCFLSSSRNVELPHAVVGLRLLLAPLSSNVVIRTASCAVGIGLPVYSTFRAIEKKDEKEKERLLLYWAAYGSFSIAEVFADKILSSVPLYYHVKFAILVWLQFPSNSGSKQVYKRYIRPFFLKHQAKIDRFLNILSKELTKFVSNHEDEIRFIENMAIRGATTANYIVNGLDQPDDSQVNNRIEGPSPTATEEAGGLGTET
ncbi:unnamed protein product [Urochloa humidicola]